MRSIISVMIVLFFLFFLPSVGRAEWVPVGALEPQEGRVEVVSEGGGRTRLVFEFPGYEVEEVEAGGRRCVRVWVPGMAPTLERGEPEVPIWTSSVIVPDRGRVSVRVVGSEWEERATLPVVPSKGNLYRTVDPATVPYEFGDVYGEDRWVPEAEVEAGAPFILRDFRGVTIEVHPVRYNGVRGKVRVLRRMEVEVVTEGEGGENELVRVNEGVAREFEGVYRGVFANLREQRYAMNERAGRMLIIAADAYYDGMGEFVTWKREKGIDTKLVRYSEIGGVGATAVKNYIQGEYNAGGLVFVLLVGDVEHIPSLTYAGGEADPMYALVAGNDVYPDLFVSRFSVQSAADLSTQVQRSVWYERTPTAMVEWYHKATGIASNEGNPPDYQWMNGFRAKLLNYTYTEMDQIYAPNATAAMVTNALNNGRSLVLYMGHGTTTSWVTTGFSNSNVNGLSNYWMLPVIHSVACVNGDFSVTTCFGEAWLRAQGGGQPKGALAAYMSSINQSWVPPQYGQQGFVDSLVNDRYNTVGGTLFGGSVAMLLQYNGGSAATEIFNTWIIFGDCSVQMRTDSPSPMVATYPGAVLVGASQIPVTVAGESGALVGISANGQYLGSGYTDGAGMVTVNLVEPLMVPGTVKVTVTAYNKVPVEGTIEVVPPSGPYVIYEGSTVLGDGQADVGEVVELNVRLKNVGVETAYGVQGAVSTTVGEVTVTEGTGWYGDIAPGATADPAAPYVIEVGSIADNTVVPFGLVITSGAHVWTGAFGITVHAPVLTLAGWQVDDASGNGNGRPDPGETIGLVIRVQNGGSGAATGTQLTLSESDPYLTISGSPSQLLGTIASGAEVASAPFTVVIDEACPQGYAVPLSVAMASNGGAYTASATLTLTVGQRELLYVDSDDEATEIRITAALNGLGVPYRRWNTFEAGMGTVPLDTLRAYRVVLWAAGDQNTSSVTEANRANLATYLNEGGSLILSAENYLSSYGSDPFTTTYLHIASYTTNVSGTVVMGEPGDPVGDGVTVTLSYPTGLAEYPDQVNPDASAAVVFRMQGTNVPVAIRYPAVGARQYRTMFFGVPLEAFPATGTEPGTIQAVISRALQWAGGTDALAPSVPGNVSLSSTGVLTWAPSTDNVGVHHYCVYRGTGAYFEVEGMTPHLTTTGTSVLVPEGMDNTFVNYTYRVTAVDWVGNESAASVPVGEFSYLLEQ